MNTPLNILILCTGNSARSIMAEAIAQRLGQGKFKAYSAGSTPRGQVHPLALELLSSKSYPTESFHSKSWETYSSDNAPPMDIVITVCDRAANEVCPVWPGQPLTAHWGVADPDRPDLSIEEQRQLFVEAYQQLEKKFRQLASLNFDELDKEEIQDKLQKITNPGIHQS